MSRVLIVEDEAISQKLFAMQLQRGGHTVLHASDGASALRLLEEEPVDLVITDLNMPVMDGITLLQELRADPRFRDLPVIVLTASTQTVDRRKAFTYDAADFLVKPVPLSALLQRVDAVLSVVDPSDGM